MSAPRTATREKEQAATLTPPDYRVLLLNDDYSTMEFVVSVLTRFFGKSEAEAVRIMLDVHEHGSGVCGVYSFEVAETKVAQVTQAAAAEGHPLRCIMEPVGGTA
ncbi:MAG TPA: ATP-dependent Clp protease adapter ClpS [Deinococcales bacterium]|nr:ATP-dependent Clp protease adapter ClpS [Deinococcales bacterium]